MGEITEKQLDYLNQLLSRLILTPMDRARYNEFIKKYPIRSLQDLQFDDARRIIAFLRAMTQPHLFPCFYEAKQNFFVSKPLKKLFGEITAYQACKHYCPVGGVASECLTWQKFFAEKEKEKEEE